MNTGWAPKPNRPDADNLLFQFVEAPTVVKALSPMQRQRMEDGTPHTRTASTALRPADPALFIRPELAKGSLVEKYDERPKMPKQEPQDPMFVVKAYMAFKGQEAGKASVEDKQKMDKSIAAMNSAIAAFSARTGTKSGS